MPTHQTEHNGHRVSRRINNDWQKTAKQAADVLSRLDVPQVIRKNPYPAMAVAAGAGLLIGVTVGSRLVRLIVGSVGMYAAGEFAKKYAKQAMQNMDFDDDDIEVD
ncbi:MAG TPA: hypothetical protein VGH87_26000 [Polyangiaceae bacterium]|jgi:hypothetical protein